MSVALIPFPTRHTIVMAGGPVDGWEARCTCGWTSGITFEREAELRARDHEEGK